MGSRATCVTLYGPDLAMCALEELSFCGLVTSLLISLSEFRSRARDRVWDIVGSPCCGRNMVCCLSSVHLEGVFSRSDVARLDYGNGVFR